MNLQKVKIILIGILLYYIVSICCVYWTILLVIQLFQPPE